jgi:hypothetical protein
MCTLINVVGYNTATVPHPSAPASPPGLPPHCRLQGYRCTAEGADCDGALALYFIRKNSSGHSSPANYVAVDSRRSWYSLVGKYIAVVVDIAPRWNYVQVYGFVLQLWGTMLCTVATLIAIVQYFFRTQIQ